jgi:hypothetical protein
MRSPSPAGTLRVDRRRRRSSVPPCWTIGLSYLAHLRGPTDHVLAPDQTWLVPQNVSVCPAPDARDVETPEMLTDRTHPTIARARWSVRMMRGGLLRLASSSARTNELTGEGQPPRQRCVKLARAQSARGRSLDVAQFPFMAEQCHCTWHPGHPLTEKVPNSLNDRFGRYSARQAGELLSVSAEELVIQISVASARVRASSTSTPG